MQGGHVFFPHALQTLEEVVGEALPDPELYLIVNGVPSKNKVVWQSIVEQLKVAIQKLNFLVC